MPQNAREALLEGLGDAIGFVGGALLGWLVGRLLGFDALGGGSGWDTRSTIGLVFVLAGCGAGKWAANRWRVARQASAQASRRTPD
jgi:hypothetical protein